MPARMETPSFPKKAFDSLRPHLEAIHQVSMGEVEVIECGGWNQVIIAPDPGLVFRFPRRIRTANPARVRLHNDIAKVGSYIHALAYEASAAGAPLRVPEWVDIGYDSTSLDIIAYTCQERLVGHTITDAYAAAHWTIREREQFATTIAECIAWLADAIPMHEPLAYPVDEFNRCSSHIRMLDRLEWVRRVSYTPAEWFNGDEHPHLSAVLYLLKDDIKTQAKKGQLRSRILGHHDLRPENVLFQRTMEGAWMAEALLDFDMARPSTPAREMRFLVQLGPEALAAAIARYKELTDEVIDPATVLFWLRVHYAGEAVYNIWEGKKEWVPFQMEHLSRLYHELPGETLRGIQ